MDAHQRALREFSGRIVRLLAFRTALRWATVWMLALGVLVLLARTMTRLPVHQLMLGMFGLVPIIAAAVWLESRRKPALSAVRAELDRHSGSGGLIMAAEQADVSSWAGRMPEARPPALRWRSGRALNLFGVSALFLALTFIIPDRYTALGFQRPLEIGKIVEELSAQIEALEEEKILKEDKAADFKSELNKLGKEALGKDPAKTWEALDHLQQSTQDLAKQAAEEAIAKMQSLAQSEALASAMSQLPDSTAGEVLTKAAQELASLLNAAKLDQGLLNASLPPELLASAKDGKLSSEQMKELMKAIGASKEKIEAILAKLENLRLIDAELVGVCKNAGRSPNPGALAAFLSENGSDAIALEILIELLGNGGVDRGRGDAPLTWKDPSDENDIGFKEQTLPPSQLSAMKDAQLVGMSKAAPEVTGEKATALSGALNAAAAGGGNARAQVILPAHKGAVNRFFKRDN
ncbi:MAG: hypothetical protein FJ386_00985 [Verrucomicrobia bacterium]|nr:hypothetical protein [Verrucomicrobiota bacterium]